MNALYNNFVKCRFQILFTLLQAECATNGFDSVGYVIFGGQTKSIAISRNLF